MATSPYLVTAYRVGAVLGFIVLVGGVVGFFASRGSLTGFLSKLQFLDHLGGNGSIGVMAGGGGLAVLSFALLYFRKKSTGDESGVDEKKPSEQPEMMGVSGNQVKRQPANDPQMKGVYDTLFEACKKGDKDRVDQLVKDKRLNLEVIDCQGWTALHHAVRQGHAEVVELLVDAQWGTASSCSSELALFAAVTIPHVDDVSKISVIKKLIDKGCDINSIDADGRTALHRAALTGQHSLLRSLKDLQANINMVDLYGETLLHLAVLSGSLETVKEVLALDSSQLEKENINRVTPIMRAVSSGHTEIAKYLYSKLSHPQKANESLDLFDYALSNLNFDFIKFLSSNESFPPYPLSHRQSLVAAIVKGHQAKVMELLSKVDLLEPIVADNDAAFCGMNCLHLAVLIGNPKIVEMLLNKISLESKDVDGGTVLHYAAFIGDTMMFASLLVRTWQQNSSMNINVKNLFGNTPLHIAALYKQAHIIEYLKSNGADGRVKNRSGETALHSAVYSADLATVKETLELFPKLLLVEDVRHYPPLFTAIACGCNDIAQYLWEQMNNPTFQNSQGMTPQEFQNSLSSQNFS